ISEPGALIGFAGPRVIRETIGKDLPKGFQSAEFVLEHGFLDFIVDRKDLKDKLSSLLAMLK
nr:acetyl-CoA carboxylase carboxyl transferase subunit beta [Flectobacillus sp.]